MGVTPVSFPEGVGVCDSCGRIKRLRHVAWDSQTYGAQEIDVCVDGCQEPDPENEASLDATAPTFLTCVCGQYWELEVEL